jgi:hypothetical protein
MIAVVVLWMLALLVLFGIWSLLPRRGRSCPSCGSETLALQSRVLRPFDGMLSHRWCYSCGWSGVVWIARVHRAGAASRAACARRSPPYRPPLLP